MISHKITIIKLPVPRHNSIFTEVSFYNLLDLRSFQVFSIITCKFVGLRCSNSATDVKDSNHEELYFLIILVEIIVLKIKIKISILQDPFLLLNILWYIC